MHFKTPRLMVSDPRGLSVRTVDYYRAEESVAAQARISRSVFDKAGRAIEQWDPRLWDLQKDDPKTPANQTTVYSLSTKALKTLSVDAGMRVQLLGLADELLRSWDSRCTRQETRYDRLLRPLAVLEQDLFVECFEYAGPDDASRERNQCGQLIRHDDPAGTLLSTEFDIRGNCIRQARRFTVDPVQPDWPLLPDDREPLLESQSYETLRRFNPLDDLHEQRDAKGNRQQHRYTLDGRVRESRWKLNGESDWHTVVSAIEYTAEGKIERQVAGNGVVTTQKYRPEDGWLMERKDRNGKVLQWLIHDYDRMGNVLSITDAAMPVRYFANQRIDPVRRYRYDSLYQLIEAFGWEANTLNKGPQVPALNDPAATCNYQQRYRHDAGGNLLKRTHVGARSLGLEMTAALYSNRCLPFRPDGQPPTQEQIAAAFDANGNLLELSPAGVMTWDRRNQLLSVSPVERDVEQNDYMVYGYDGDRQRVRKVRSLQTNARTVVYEVRYLLGLELRIDSGTGEVLDVITLQAGLISVRVLHWPSAAPRGIANVQYRYSLADHQGSCTIELAGDGSVISQEVFYSYGETAWSEGIDRHKTLRYAGKERDATGLHYYGLRYYAAWLQRWINPDPGGAIDGPNRYRAMRNNPLFYRDADGRVPTPNQQTEDGGRFAPANTRGAEFPVALPQVLAERRDTVANVIQVTGKYVSYSRHPLVGAIGSTMEMAGKLLEVSDAQAQMNSRQQSNIKALTVEGLSAGGRTAFTVDRPTASFLAASEVPLSDTAALPASLPSSLALRLLAAEFNSPAAESVPVMVKAEEPQVAVRKRSRSSSVGRAMPA
ncbi:MULTISPECIES: RHS repeat-associated core domain-containing protein [unclassified Pseudomonas]|uniref:RHS repeat-associated core domain-containing protein n=1 Tax=unclassified Pseudomonas TaxID=196821 RepID=UPI000CD30EC1|nr:MULTISPECIES: RHS repeat-associated core domain-containing protein [unclassified Pseudomonas]POA32416.1 type IV secretion protein Rhs [Pseudomonas sp. GW456-R21]POA68954.1 type IV secretion protein Rhs [Pseudomonas sp. GW460-R15]